MKKILCTILTVIMLCQLIPVFAAVGDVKGNIYYTDIQTYMNGALITSYNIGGTTVIDAEALANYGFGVIWHADTRRLEITNGGANAAKLPENNTVAAPVGEVGAVFGYYYETDIITTLDGAKIESYNLGGKTCIVAEAMKNLGYPVEWNAEKRTVTITSKSGTPANPTYITSGQTAVAATTEPLVLMYHLLLESGYAPAYTLPVSVFEEDIKYLSEQGYKFCIADEFDRYIKSGEYDKIVAITFDDGYASDYLLALPILEKYNACATFYIVGSLIDTEGYMTKEQLLELSKSPNVQIGNHYYDLHNLSYDELKPKYTSEIDYILSDYEKNQAFLKDVTGKDITSMSYPYGLYSDTYNALMKEKNVSTFCSDERAARNSNLPYGRYTRSADVTLQFIINKAQRKAGVTPPTATVHTGDFNSVINNYFNSL